MENITIIKYGTSVLTTKDSDDRSCIDRQIITQHGQIIAQHDQPTVLVSSGAVGLGATVLDPEKISADTITKKRLLSEIGQPRLFDLWQQSLPQRVLLQKLVTYSDLTCQNTAITIEAALRNKLLYIFNFNDGVDDAELREDTNQRFGDNDHLAAEIAIACQPLATTTRFILNTSADGVLDTQTQKVFAQLTTADITEDFIAKHCQTISAGGTGGMASKLRYVKQALLSGVNEAWIINGKDPQQLQAILQNKHTGTKITLS